MSEQQATHNHECHCNHESSKKEFVLNTGMKRRGADVGAIMFLGFIGAAIYYVSNATDFWDGALGILKAIVWPAFLVFEALTHLS